MGDAGGSSGWKKIRPSYSNKVAMDSFALSLILTAEVSCRRESTNSPESIILMFTPRLEIMIKNVLIVIALLVAC
jgi:hypothetical protein